MRIVWLMPDGSKRVTTPGSPMLDGETERAYLDRVAARTKEALPDLKDAMRLPNITDAEHAEMRKTRREAQK
mgnify:CR=1 FL=1